MNISHEQLAAVKNGEPLRFSEPGLGLEFVVMRADDFDRVKAALDDGDFDPREAMPLFWQVMKDDWEDPAMDVFDQSPEKPDSSP